MRKSVTMGAMLLVLGWAASSCGLIKMPFRVAGSVASHTYQAGKRVVKKSTKSEAANKSDSKTKPAETNPAGNPAANAGPPPGGTAQPPAWGGAPPPPADPNVPEPPADLPELPGDILPPLPPEELPPL
jgi:hypothetical protein